MEFAAKGRNLKEYFSYIMFEWFVGLRYLRAKHKHGFISLISLISVAGISIGVIAIITVLAVYSGFTEGFRNQILNHSSHIDVQQMGKLIDDYELVRNRILTVNKVTGATPYLVTQSLLSSANGSVGVVLRGINPKTAQNVIGLARQMSIGSIHALDREIVARQPNIFLGKNLAEDLRVGVGDRVRLISPSGLLTTSKSIVPRIKTCVVSGIFSSGMSQYNSSQAYMSFADVQNFLGIDDVAHGIAVAVQEDELNHANEIARAIAGEVGPNFVVRDWMMMNHNLFAAFRLEKIGIFIAMILIVLVAALNIISALVMVVMEKNKDIAILKSMGAASAAIMKIFFIQGLVLAITGTAFGVAGGLGLCELLAHYQFIELPTDMYPTTTLPIKIMETDVIIVAISTIFLTLLATLYPSWKASIVKPAEVL